MPSGKKCTIPLIYNSQDEAVPYAKPGENIKIPIKGIKETDVSRGCIICSKDRCKVCYEFEAKIKILELPEHKPIMSNGYSCVLHLHTSMENIKIKKIKGSLHFLLNLLL